MNLVHFLLGKASLLRKPVMILLHPVFEEACPLESSKDKMSVCGLSIEGISKLWNLNDTVHCLEERNQKRG
jgi:hypothetical protein